MPNFRSFSAVSAILWLFEAEKEGKIEFFFTALELKNLCKDKRY
jgi:hypothetical protein